MRILPASRWTNLDGFWRLVLSIQAVSCASIITGAAIVADGGSTTVDVPTLAFGRL